MNGMHDPNYFIDKYYDASLSFSRIDEGNVADGKSKTTRAPEEKERNDVLRLETIGRSIGFVYVSSNSSSSSIFSDILAFTLILLEKIK